MALLAKEPEGFRVKNEKAVGAKVIPFELITGHDEGEEERWYGVGCYLPPLTKRGRYSGGYYRLLGSSRRLRSPLSSAALTATWTSLGQHRRMFWRRRWRGGALAASAGTLGRDADGGTVAGGHGGNNGGTGGASRGCNTASRIIY